MLRLRFNSNGAGTHQLDRRRVAGIHRFSLIAAFWAVVLPAGCSATRGGHEPIAPSLRLATLNLAPGATMSFQTPNGGAWQTVQGESAPDLEIPDSRAGGITDTIVIDQDATIAAVKVSLDISHTYRGDLRVTLLTPWGDAVVLHQRHQGGSADNIQRTIDESDVQALATLHGHSTKGSWTLLVQDLAPVDVGTLNRWALEFAAVTRPLGPVVLEETPGTHIPDNDSAGIQRSLPPVFPARSAAWKCPSILPTPGSQISRTASARRLVQPWSSTTGAAAVPMMS